MMVTSKDILEWATKKIAGTRLNAMHAYNRGDTAAFERINREMGYWDKIATDYQKKVEEECLES